MYWDRFDICEAWFIYLSEHHEGQFSDKYARLCHLLTFFKPSPFLRRDRLTENGKAILDNLER
jgi:hypothetical protein